MIGKLDVWGQEWQIVHPEVVEPGKVAELQKLYASWNAEQEEPRWRPNPNAKKKGQKAKKAAKAAVKAD